MIKKDNDMTLQFSVTQDGTFHDYKWDEETRTFSTNASELVLNFSNVNGVTFTTGKNCAGVRFDVKGIK